MRSCFLGFLDCCCLYPALLQSDFKLCHPLYQVLGCKADGSVITTLLFYHQQCCFNTQRCSGLQNVKVQVCVHLLQLVK